MEKEPTVVADWTDRRVVLCRILPWTSGSTVASGRAVSKTGGTDKDCSWKSSEHKAKGRKLGFDIKSRSFCTDSLRIGGTGQKRTGAADFRVFQRPFRPDGSSKSRKPDTNYRFHRCFFGVQKSRWVWSKFVLLFFGDQLQDVWKWGRVAGNGWFLQSMSGNALFVFFVCRGDTGPGGRFSGCRSISGGSSGRKVPFGWGNPWTVSGKWHFSSSCNQRSSSVVDQRGGLWKPEEIWGWV